MVEIVHKTFTNFQNTCKLTNKLNLMKKLLFSAMALSMVFFSACEKDETTPNRMLDDNSQKEKTISVNKSVYTALDSMAMAAGVDQIIPTIDGYELTFHNDPTIYDVEIVSFNDTVEIEYVITPYGGSSQFITIDVINETIGSSSFNTFAQSPISESRNILERITAVTTVHHALNPAGSDSFGDNGDEDEYPDDIEDTGIFWGKRTENMGVTGGYGGSPCYQGTWITKYRFWIKTYDDIEYTEVACP